MPALAQPTGSQILATLLPSGDGAFLGDWTEERIDNYIANALVNLVTMEFDYATELLVAAGKVPATLSQADWNKATLAMIYGIGFQLMGIDFTTDTPISGENGGVSVDAYMKSDSRFFNLAGNMWESLAITSRYTRTYVVMTVGSTTRNNLLPTSINSEET